MADNSTCLSGAPAFRLADNYICNPGFYCPNNSEEHPPEYCPPTSSCQSIRLQLQRNICPEAQGAFEPLICPPGSYCPPGGKAIHACPPKHFCPLGSAHPNRCGLTSICPAGSVREFRLIGFVLVIAIDIVLALMSWWLMRRLKKKSVACRVEEGKITPTSESKTTSQATEDDLREYISSVSRVTGGDGIGLSFTFSDMSYSIPNSNVKIISSMTGEIRKGRLCAVMGASGAGKSTFVDLLIGKKEPESGSRLVNNKPIDSSLYNKAVGYVPQDSSLLPELTVRETLLHSARVRLPRSWTNDELLHHLNLVQRLLKLNHVQHDLVGDHTNHTLSGGERKRVSIGIELSSSPMALILDEPTSGLDASSAFSVVTLLRQLAQMGVTIILIIHQPRKEIFDCIDDVILLEGGQAAYQGPRSHIQEYFQSLGFQFPPASNPADVIMDIISHRMQTQDGKYFSQTNRTLSDLGNLLERPSSDEEAPGTNDDAAAATHSWIKKSRLGASWLRQFWLCTLRSLKQQQRRASSFFLEIAVGGVAGLLIGLSLYSYQGLHFQGVYLAPFERLSTSVTNMTVAMIALMVCMAIGLTASPPGVKTFGEEKSIYWRERRSGHSISAYYVGKVVSTLPRILISALHFTSFYTILATPTMSFWESYCVNVVYFYAIYGLASCISILVRKENGPLIAVIVCLIVSVLGGHGPSLHTVKEWHLEWFWRMCPGTWASEAYIDKTFQRVGYLYDIHAAAESAGFTLGRYGLSVCMIIILGTAYRAAAFVAMLLWKDGL